VKPLFYIFVLLLLSGCTPLQDTRSKNKIQKIYTGFSSGDSFQIVCNINILPDSIIAEERKLLLENCRKIIATNLAGYKIAYDMNIHDYLFKPGTFISAKGASASMNKTQIDVLSAPKNYTLRISNIQQVHAQWNDTHIDMLMKLYKNFFPGRILLEWNNEKTLFFLYEIRQKGLMNTIKNTSLPFGIEFE